MKYLLRQLPSSRYAIAYVPIKNQHAFTNYKQKKSGAFRISVKKEKKKRGRRGRKNVLCTFEKGYYGTSTFLCRPSRKSTIEKRLEILTNVFGMHYGEALPFGEIGI